MRPDIPTDQIYLYESVRLPDSAEHEHFGRFVPPGVYARDGSRIGELKDRRHYERGVVFVEYAGVNFVWGVFSRPLSPRELGVITFENVPGSAPITAMFGEWDRKQGIPAIGEAIFPLISVQRGTLTARITGKNAFSGELPAAAGFILSPTAEMPR